MAYLTTCARSHIATVLLAAVASAALLSPAAPAFADDTAGLVTVSLSGSTAMRNFTVNAGFSQLTPGTSITIGGVTYTAPNTPTTAFQLAPTAPPASPNHTPGGTYADLFRIEWHEQGSVEGINELIYSQINGIAQPSATSGNPTWVNRNSTKTGLNGWTLAQQNAVQMAISDVNHVQGYAIAGTPNLHATPTSSGYGLGNPALPAVSTSAFVTGTNTSAKSYSLFDQHILDMPAAKFGSGDWNTAGVDNAQSTQVAVTATTFAANPGTGLSQINRTDAQWLQSASRLQNGAEFNFASRDVNSGTRNVAANNTGVDPSWAVGKNDSGNGNANDATTTQISLNPNGLTFSNKTAGGGQLRPTVQINRMAVGTLGLSDVFSSAKNNSSSSPLRALAYSDSADGSTPAVIVSAQSIVDGTYALWQNQTYVTLKDPSHAANIPVGTSWADATDAQTGILGDSSDQAVAQLRANVLYGAQNFNSVATYSNPGDALLGLGFIPKQLMSVTKTVDGVNTSSANPNLSTSDQALFLAGSYPANSFNVKDPTLVTTGASSVYGKNGTSQYTTPTQGNITITTKNYLFANFNAQTTDGGVTYTGTRDLAAIKTALAAQAAMGSDTTYNTGAANSTVVYTNANGVAFTKGDLIVMGDTLSRGKFDGKDLYNMAHGMALSNSTSTDNLTTGDYRTGILRKNAALDYLHTNANTQQKAAAAATLTVVAVGTQAAPVTPALPAGAVLISTYDSITGTSADLTKNSVVRTVTYTYDSTGLNAFNKADTTHDGLVDLNDALAVDNFNGQDFTNLNQQLAATVTTDGQVRSINLTNMVLADGRTTVNASDLAAVNSQLTGTGNSKWFAGTQVKTGSGTLNYARTGGTVVIDPNAKLQLTSGSLQVTGTVDPFTDNSTGFGTTGNKLALTVGGGTNSARLSVNASVSFGTAQVDIEKSGSVVITAGATQDSVRSLIHTGKFTSVAHAASQGLGYLSAADYNVLNPSDLLPAGSIITRYTWLGDADLDGKITGVDFAQIDAAYLSHNFSTGTNAHWINGDFNHDGLITTVDFALLDAAFTAYTNGGSLALARVTADSQRFGSEFVAAYDAALASVPEPTSLALLGVGAVALLRRRK